MLSEKDSAVVAAYARTGMSLETLIASFPGFAREDVEAVFQKIKSEYVEEEGLDTNISINCS